MELSSYYVGKLVDRHLSTLFGSSEQIHNFLKRHPKRNTLEEALLREMQTITVRKALKSNAYQVDQTVKDVIKFWATQILDQAEHALKTDAEKRRLADENRREEIARDTVRDITENIEEDDFNVQEL